MFKLPPTQALTGHGSFKTYTFKIGKTRDASCVYCGEEDSPRHTLFSCERWAGIRRECEVGIGDVITANNMVDYMLQSETKWKEIERAMTRIMTTKEQDERRHEGTRNN
ncbi:uncharacterized protein LOC108911539 [Anoplophora glabripennis]|uniref:uncharacterized protein LOC108911539 n=1 Tax=Anoplophora glabripennis TaxID=217634 RepID=UPI000874D768|nr:uncharacterized protein LOC108911539 [Anoplophora glabripennis]